MTCDRCGLDKSSVLLRAEKWPDGVPKIKERIDPALCRECCAQIRGRRLYIVEWLVGMTTK